MNKELLKHLEKITEEEKALLHGQPSIQKGIYTSKKDFVVDNERLLAKGRLIEIRPHTRFAHFPKHRHNYVEMVYILRLSIFQIQLHVQLVQPCGFLVQFLFLKKGFLIFLL